MKTLLFGIVLELFNVFLLQHTWVKYAGHEQDSGELDGIDKVMQPFDSCVLDQGHV